jgi:hypothetical protein
MNRVGLEGVWKISAVVIPRLLFALECNKLGVALGYLTDLTEVPTL